MKRRKPPQSVYCASKARHWPWWQVLRSLGVPIAAPWIDAPFNRTGEEPSPPEWKRHWHDCIAGARSADICLAIMRKGEQHAGALIECGAALAAGRQVYVVDEIGFSFVHHPHCYHQLKCAPELSRHQTNRKATPRR
jgi:hypothetical protein